MTGDDTTLTFTASLVAKDDATDEADTTDYVIGRITAEIVDDVVVAYTVE